MRLTLRTLLAYLDGVLEPADRDDIHQQIEASDYARDLVHRTRDVSRRMRLGAPEPLGGGPIDDPNTMAEYLDNALPMESVPEFERHCLESDVMLAEASASHHVLAMVLGRPAEVDPDTRRRVHELPAKLREMQRLRVESAHAPAAAPPEPVAAPAERSELPDYLRESESDALRRWAPALAALVLLAATAFVVFGLDAGGEGPAVAASAGDEAASPVTPAAIAPPADEAEDAEAAPAEADEPPHLEAEEPIDVEGIVASGDTIAETDPEPMAEPGLSEGPEAAADDTAVALGAPPSVDEAPVETPAITPAVPVEVAGVDEELGGDGPVAAPPTPAFAGRFIGPPECLLVVESAPDAWLRVPTEADIDFGSRLLALPTYRGRVELGGGVELDLVGPAEVTLPDVAEDASPRVELRYGRIVIANRTDEPQRVSLRIAEAAADVDLDAGGWFAVESDHPFQPGADVRAASPPAVSAVYAPAGGVAWLADGLRLMIDSGKQWRLAEGGGLEGFGPYRGDPGWIEPKDRSPLDAQTSEALAGAVALGEAVWPQLREAAEGDPFKEVRALAALCSAAVNHADPLIASFSDEAQRVFWVDHLAELRRIVSRSPAEAEQVRKTLVEQHGELLAEDLFRLIRGFSEEQIGSTEAELQRGELPQLIAWLESEAEESRVLANLVLEEVTGRQGVFDPTDVPGKRRRAVARVRKWFKANELRVDQP